MNTCDSRCEGVHGARCEGVQGAGCEGVHMGGVGVCS